MSQPASRQDRYAVALLLLLPTLFFGDVLLGWTNFYMRDLTRYYYPTKQVYRDVVLGGEFPFWNRRFHAGQPIAANPEHEIFYPLTWLILLPDYDLGYRLHILVHIYIGLLGMYAFLRSLQLGPPAALFGAISFGLGGIYLSYINLLPILFCAAWLPITSLFVRRFLLGKHPRDFGLAGLSLGLQFLVGEPTTVMQTGLLLGAYALYRGWREERRWLAMSRNVMWVGAISLCAFAVGAAQMFPAIDHVGESARARSFEFNLVSAWSMPWAKLAELIYPNLLGHIAVDRVMWYWAGGLYPGMGSPFLFSIYPGLAVTALVIGGIFSRARGWGMVVLVILFSALIALGGNTPLLGWLYKAGVATSIRYPEKFILMALFVMIIFAAQMLERILEAGDDAVRETAAGFALATGVVAAVVAALTLHPIWSQTFNKIFGLTAGSANARKMFALAQTDWAVAALRGFVLLALLLAARMPRRGVWLAAALLFLCADLGLVMHELNPRMPARFFEAKPPVVSQLPANRNDYRIFHEADWYGTEEIARKYFSTGKAVYWIVRAGMFPMTPAGHGFQMVMERDYDKTALLPTIDFTDSVWDVKRSGRKDWWLPMMAMSNAWYRGVYNDFEEQKRRVGGHMQRAFPIRFDEIGRFPRYYMASDVVTIQDRKDFVSKLTKESHDLRTAFIKGPSFRPAAAKVTGVWESANRAVIDVEASGKSFLIMSVTPHKYWRVMLDGKAVSPIITNIGYQGLVIPGGRHRVTMRYFNDLVRVGGMVSAAALVFLLVLVIVPWKNRIA